LALSLRGFSGDNGGMNAVAPPSRSGFDRPATYRIEVLGGIPATWSDRLEGMAVTESSGQAGSLVTTLEGELADQVALVSVVNTLVGLHLSVVSVERLSAG
jgi:hypothetical protein